MSFLMSGREDPQGIPSTHLIDALEIFGEDITDIVHISACLFAQQMNKKQNLA